MSAVILRPSPELAPIARAAAIVALILLSGCVGLGCYERTPDGLGINACKGKSW